MDFLENTYFQEVKERATDKISVEIGDSKQPDFKPQVKIMRWDNEVNFSMRAEEYPSATVEEKDGVIKYITPNYEVHQYSKPEAGEDGGFEFEWVLKEKPKLNILTATVASKGLDFYYQPELTEEEIERGLYRSDDVVGSYAVYHSTKGGVNDSDGMEYKTGKAFHIYRPKAKDVNGNETWCDLNIAEGLLTVTVPQDFLDKATYPIIVDPTLGYTSLGASDGILSASTFTARLGYRADSISGVLVDINAYVKLSTGGSGHFTAAVYDHNGGLGMPNTPMGSTQSNVYTETSYTLKTLASNIMLTSSATYWAVIQGDDDGGTFGFHQRCAYDSGNTLNYGAGFATDTGLWVLDSNRYSLYINYKPIVTGRTGNLRKSIQVGNGMSIGEM